MNAEKRMAAKAAMSKWKETDRECTDMDDRVKTVARKKKKKTSKSE